MRIEDDPMDEDEVDDMRSPPPPNSTPTFQRKRPLRDDEDGVNGEVRLRCPAVRRR